jgi:hypothetical protein
MTPPALPWIAALAIALAAPGVHAAQRAFVSSTGNDANAPSGCTPALPCRSFQAAHGAVDPGGEIVALDTAGYGTVTITKSVSIIGNPGTIPSISVTAGNGVTIATAGVRVLLRNLNINGVGGARGVQMTSGDALTVENSVVSNFTDSGVYAWTDGVPAIRISQLIARGNSSGIYIGGTARADISSSILSGNSAGLVASLSQAGVTFVAVNDTVASGNSSGFIAAAYNGGTTRMSLTRVTASNNSNAGVYNSAGVGGTAIMTVGASMATANNIGFYNEMAGGVAATFRSLGNNIVVDNGMDSFGPITPLAGL